VSRGAPRVQTSAPEITDEIITRVLEQVSDAVGDARDATPMTPEQAAVAVVERGEWAMVRRHRAAMRRDLAKVATAAIMGIAALDAGAKP